MKYSELLSSTLMKRYPNPDMYPYRSWCYPQGFMLWGMKMLWEYTGDAKYYDYIILYADTHVDGNGNINKFKGNSMDDMQAGSVIAWAYGQTGAKKYKKACKTIRNAFNDYPRNSRGGFWHERGKNEMWVDGVFMGQMFLAHYGYYIGEKEYCYGESAKQLAIICELCRKGNTGLILHAIAEHKDAEWADPVTGLSPEVWSEGLGWYALILAEVLAVFDKNHPEREILITQYKQLLESLKHHQDKHTGLWHQVVDKGDRPDNWHDTAGSAMFMYSIMKAVKMNIVSRLDYGECIQKAYKGLVRKARLNDGNLVDIYDACDGLCVQESYDIYVNYIQKINAKEAVAAFLWAVTEYEWGYSKQQSANDIDFLPSI